MLLQKTYTGFTKTMQNGVCLLPIQPECTADINFRQGDGEQMKTPAEYNFLHHAPAERVPTLPL